MPANLYGEGDNFNLNSSHVLPALTKKFIIAKINNYPNVQFGAQEKSKRVLKC